MMQPPNIDTAPVLAALYARVSTDRQAGDDRVSLATQRAEYLAYCERHGYQPSGREYVDVMSGVREDRPEYRQMLRDALSGQFHRIIALDPTRFGRDEERAVYDLLGVKLQTKGCVQVEFIHGRHRSLSDVVEDLEDGAKERRRLSTRVRVNLITVRRDRGRILGAAPYGYRKVAASLQVDEAQAAIVREIFRRYLAGEGTPTITKDLNRRGVPALRGGRWGSPGVARMLRHRAYRGESVWHSTDRDGGPVSGVIPCPAIIPPAEFDAVQALLDRRGELYTPRGVASDYLLSGLVSCGLCGGRLSGATNPRGPRSRRYRCQGRRNTCDPSWGMLAEPLERAVLAQLSTLGVSEDVRQEFAAQAEEARQAVAAAEQQVTTAQGRMSRVLDLYADDRMSADDWSRERPRLEAEIAGARAVLESARAEHRHRQARADQAATVATRIRSFVSEAEALPLPTAKARLQTIVRHVKVYGRTGRFEVELL